MPLAAVDESLKTATESLVRLGALRSGAIGGTDLAAGDANAHDFTDCYTGPLRHDWDYQHRTYCSMQHDSAALSLAVPRRWPTRRTARSSRSPPSAPTRTTRRDARAVDRRRTRSTRCKVDGSWDEYRFVLPAGSLHAGRVQAQLQRARSGRALRVDHVLLLPRTSELIAQRGPD